MSIIIKKYKATSVMEGAGVEVNRVFGHANTTEFDPFLMLDYFDQDDLSNSPGFPWHPHKGMETISYFLRGAGEHQDSMGNKGVIESGELQWMSAGRGIYHQEMPVASGNGAQGFQFWVNLPAKAKLKDPEYQYIKRDKMRYVETENSKVKVIAGIYQDVVGPIDKSDLGITMIHAELEHNSKIELSRTKGKQGFIFMFEGDGKIENKEINSIAAYTLNDGVFTFSSGNEGASFIFAEGIPIKEPISWHGPIVMNTREEIEQTIDDLNNNRFIK